MKLTKKFIKENSEMTLKEAFPEVFESALEIGKWYKDELSELLFFVLKIRDRNNINGYGFDRKGVYYNSENNYEWGTPNLFKPATPQEIQDALEKEAVRRGFVKGTCIIDIYNGKKENDTVLVSSEKYDYEPVIHGVNQNKMSLRDSDGNILFIDGIWATIIQTITKQEAAERLGMKII